MWSTVASLQVHPSETSPFDLKVNVVVSPGEFILDFKIQGPVQTLKVPTVPAVTSRRDQLWQSTCLEAFMALPQQKAYIEWNWSPSGDWACYSFSGYRSGMVVQPLDGTPQIQTQIQGDECQARILLTTQHLQQALVGYPDASWLHLGLTAVLETKNGQKSHWALSHHTDRPDFHRMESFNCLVPLTAESK